MLGRRWILAAAVLASACGSSPTPTSPAPVVVRRLAVLGDSLAVSPTLDQSFPAQLQARIVGLGLAWSVVNAGVSGDRTARIPTRPARAASPTRSGRISHRFSERQRGRAIR
jgi:hypothetical protein